MQPHFATKHTWPQFTATVGIVPFSPCLSCSRTLCLISSVTPDLHCWETASGGRQTRKRAATVTRSIVTSILVLLCSQTCWNAPYVLHATTARDWQLDNCICFYSHHYVPIIWNPYNLITVKLDHNSIWNLIGGNCVAWLHLKSDWWNYVRDTGIANFWTGVLLMLNSICL